MLSSRSGRRIAPLVLGLPCVGAVVLFGELSTAALVAVVLTGGALAGVGLAWRAGAAAPPVGRAGLPWVAWLGVAVVLELLAFVHDGVPTVSDLLDPVLAHPPLRGAATVLWLAAGGWLLARSAPRDRSR